MARLPLADVNRLSSDARAQYDRFPSNLTRTLLLLDPRLAQCLPETVNALRASDLEPLTREAINLRAVLAFTDQCIDGAVQDTTFDAARSALGDRGLVTAIVLVGHYMTVARITAILHVELDDHPDPWIHEH